MYFKIHINDLNKAKFFRHLIFDRTNITITQRNKTNQNEMKRIEMKSRLKHKIQMSMTIEMNDAVNEKKDTCRLTLMIRSWQPM